VFGGAVAAEGWRDGIAQAEAAAELSLSAMQRAQWVDCQEWLPNDLLTKLDRTLMVHSVEGRTPFLDPLVADFAFGLADRQKAGVRFGKLLLREWLEAAFPAAGAWAKKKGFKPPVGAWIAARGAVLAELVAAQPGVASLVRREVVLSMMDNAGRESQPAWSLLFYALWHSHHVMGIDASGDIASVLEAARA
jgi:asparagine synthase (glutamine-hydrolysing)